MKKVITIVLTLASGLLVGCDQQPTSDTIIAGQQEKSMQEMVRQTGLPAIRNFQEKKMLKMLYELRDSSKLVCYAYLVNEMNGEIGQFIGKCIGYGLPYTAQYSNPKRLVYKQNLGYHSMPQAEPNGLFMPQGLSATWLMMIDPKTGDPKPVYIEPAIIVSPFPLK